MSITWNDAKSKLLVSSLTLIVTGQVGFNSWSLSRINDLEIMVSSVKSLELSVDRLTTATEKMSNLPTVQDVIQITKTNSPYLEDRRMVLDVLVKQDKALEKVSTSFDELSKNVSSNTKALSTLEKLFERLFERFMN